MNMNWKEEETQVRLRIHPHTGEPIWSIDYAKAADELERNPNLKTLTCDVLRLDSGEVVPEPHEILAIFPELAKGEPVSETKYRKVVKMLQEQQTEKTELPTPIPEPTPISETIFNNYEYEKDPKLCQMMGINGYRSQIPVHPAAECTRMMDDEELASLAASIKANGQCDPIILGRVKGTYHDQIVDGRNRREACKIAGVDPRFEYRDFEDDEAVKAFVASKSEHRNISKGQMAMRIALLWPEPEKGGRGNKRVDQMSTLFSAKLLQRCRVVLAYSCELALAVRDGTVKLSDALKQIKAEPKLSQKYESLGEEAPPPQTVEVTSTLSTSGEAHMESQQTLEQRCEHLECEREQLEQRCVQLEYDLEQHKKIILELKQTHEIELQQAKDDLYREMCE